MVAAGWLLLLQLQQEQHQTDDGSFGAPWLDYVMAGGNRKQ
jgi:hypothetical protein